MAEQKKRTSDGLYSALMQISKEEGVDFGLSGMSADDFKNKYFTGPGNIENLYHRLNKISKEEGIDFGQGSRDEWLSSFGYKRNGDGQRGYQTLDGRPVGRRKSPAPTPQPQRKDSVNAEDGYIFTEGGLDSAFNQGFPVRAVDGQGKPLSTQPQPKPGNGVATTFGTPYKPDYQLTAAQRDEIHRRNDFAARQMQQMGQRMREEEQRRNKPIADTGSEAVNRHVIKTKGQWEDELGQGARRISSSVVVPAVDKAVKAFDKKADEIWGEYNEQSKFVDAASPFSVVTARRANEAKDPDKILDYLKKQMEGVYTDKSFVEEVAREADKMGIDRGEYIEKVVKPQIEADLGAHLGETLMKREMPKSTADYILGGLGNSIVGMLYNAMTETKGQRAYKNQAAAMTEEGHNPYYQPGTGARLTQMGVTFAADAPFFGLYGKVGGQVAKQVAEQQIKRLMAKGLSEGAARSVVGTALENSVGARMKNYLMQHVISGSITMGGFNMTSETARQVRDSEFSPGRILESGAEGAVTGAAFGLTGGAVQAVSQPLSGIARIGAATGGFLAEAETMYATEELSKMVHGEEGFTNPFEGSVEALMKLGVMKASSGHPLMKAVETGASIGRNGVRKTVANALAAKQSGMRFTEDEEAYVRNSTEGKNLLDALSQMHPETAIGEVNGKKKLTAEGEQLRQQLADRYNDFMGNTEIPYGVKMKVARALGGLMPDAAHTPLETGADIIHHADGSVTVKTRDKDGNCMQDFKFDTFSDAEAWRDAHEEQFRLNDAVNMWNGSPMEARTKMLSELMEEYGVDAQQARQMIDATLNGSMGTSFEGEQFLDIYDTIRRNAYPADEPHTRRNYWEGRKISPEERHQAMLEAQRAEERLEYTDMSFADELREAVDYPDEKIAELAGREDITGEQLQAAINYFNKMSKVNGMMEEAANSVDQQVEAANDFIRRNTHTGSGRLIECEQGGNGYYVTAGNIKLNPDGSIDGAGSGDVIIVRDKITGEIEVVNPRNVMVTAISDPSRMIADNDSMDGLRGRLMKEADDSITLSPDTPTEPQNGDMFTASDGNRYVAMQMDDGQGNASWVKMALNENMEPEGEPQPLDIDEYRKAKSIELDELNMPREEQREPADGLAENGQKMHGGAGTMEEATGRQSGQRAGGEVATVSQHTGQPLASRIPVDEKGRPQYEQATPEDTMAELTEKYGEEKAQRMVATLAENTARHLEELSQKDTSKMTDMADLAAHEDALAEAQRKAAYWQGLMPEDKAGSAVIEVDESGKPFVFATDGTTTFGVIDASKGISEAPVKLTEGDESHGLVHMEKKHGKQIRSAGYNSVQEFVEYVAKNYTQIKEGIDAGGNPNGTYLLQAVDSHNNTLYIELSKDGNYWQVNSGGVFRKGYGDKYKTVWSASEVQNRESAPDNTLRPTSNAEKTDGPNGTVSNTIYKKGTSASSSDIETEPEGKQNGTAPLQDSLPKGKGTENILNGQGNWENSVDIGREAAARSLAAEPQGTVARQDAAREQEKIYRGSAEANIGRTFTFTNNAGVRSELTIRRIDRDGNAVVARRDYDAEGNPIGEVREESYAATKVGEAIVGSTWKKVQSTEERLREAYKGRVGILNIIDVLTEPEMEQMLAAHDRGDNDALRELQNEFVERHREDIILRGRDKRNQKVGDILGGGFSIGEKLRRIRKQFQGYDDAELALSDEALQPSTLEEYVADLHNSIPKSGEGPLAYFSYERDGVKVVGMQDETGHGLKSGGDTKGYAPWLAPKGKGMSLAKYAENIHEQLPDGVKEQYSDQDVRNAIIEVFGGAERPSDIPTMIIRRGVIQAEQAARRMEEMWIDGVSYQKKPKSFADRLRRGIEMTSTEPTEAQKAAGNYAKGHVSFGGYDFTIENPAGSVRSGVDGLTGQRWAVTMHNTYGYILGRYGKDGDHLDMFINDRADLDEWNGRVYVVDQVRPVSRTDGHTALEFDEHKVMYGFDSEEEARQAYLSNYGDGWQGLGRITGVSKEKFDEWLDSSKRKMKPFAEHSIGREAAVEDLAAEEQGTVARQEAAEREQVLRDAVIEHMQKHGMDVIIGEEGQRVLDEFNGKLTDDLKQMGTSTKKRQQSIAVANKDVELTDEQRKIVDVFSGNTDKASVSLVDKSGKTRKIILRQGNERRAGVKHSVYRHYLTEANGYTADEVPMIPEIIVKGERKQDSGVRVSYRFEKDGITYTVTTEVKGKDELFTNFYTNRKPTTVEQGTSNTENRHVQPQQTALSDKTSSAARLTAENSTARRIDNVNGHTNTQLSAQADTNNASSGAKVRQNTETAKDSEENKPKFFKTPDGEAYGYTYKGKIYIDPKIANSETPIHEYGHLWTGMKRASAPEEWAEIKKVLLGDRLVKPIIDKVREEYPELTTEGREDDFVEELLTQFSGKRGAERLREVAEQVARENGGVFGKAEAVTAMQRLKNVLNRFWESVARMLGVKYRNANDIADMMMRDFLNGVNPRETKDGTSGVKEAKVVRMNAETVKMPEKQTEELYTEGLKPGDALSMQNRVLNMSPKELIEQYRRLNGEMLDEDGLNVDEQEEKFRQEYFEKNGTKGFGPALAEFSKGMFDKYTYNKMALRWDVLDRIKELGIEDYLDKETDELPDTKTAEFIRMQKVSDEQELQKPFHDVIDDMFKPDFDKSSHSRERYNLGKTPDYMKKVGITGDNFSLSFKNIKTHQGKDADHALTQEEWHQLPSVIKEPFLITKLKDSEGKFRLFVNIMHDGHPVAVGVDVKRVNQGKGKPMLEVNSIKTVFGHKDKITDNQEIVTYDERMTPEQEALLRGLDYREYPSIQELSGGKGKENNPNYQENGQENAVEAPKFQKVGDESGPEPELTPEERQYWTQWEGAMKKWKERNGLPADAQMPTERPKFRQGEQALDYAKRLMQHNRELALWQTAPKMEDYRQVRLDKDSVDAARENEERYPASPSAKMRRVAAEALRLRHAMSRQKVYDKATVKAVTDFAQDFMRMGFGDNLSRGEMERMLSSVKNATGAKDIRKQVDNIMNILIDNQLRNLDQQVVKLSSVKELKQTAQGVEAQGKLELKGQRMIQAFREARQERMTADKIRERMAEVSEKMTRKTQEAPMWEQEYEGLTIALQYAENIEGSREEWADLDREYKDAVKEYKQSGRSYQAQQELLESLEQAMMENKVERIGMFGDIIGRLEGNISESIQGAKEFVEREKQRVRHIREMADADLAGKDMSAMRTDDRGRAVGKGKAANFFLQPLGTFEQMLRQFGSRNANGEGYLYDHFMRTWMDATDNAYVNEVKAKEALDAKAREVFNGGSAAVYGTGGRRHGVAPYGTGTVKRWSDLYELSTKEAADVEVVDQGEKKTLKLTQGNLLYIYMADKMADGRMKLRKMGIDEEHIEQIKEAIDPRLLQLGDWLQDEYLVKKRTEYNKVHERMFGAPMAAIDHYFPIKILGDARIREQDVANMADQTEVLPSTITDSIIKRRRNALPLDILHTDALSLALEHIEDMERWAAQAEWNKDVNTLLSYTAFRNKVKNMKTIYGSGDALWNAFADTAGMAAGTYRPKVKPGSVDTAISNIAKGVTAAKINFRVYTAFKQTLSAPAFLHDVDLGDFVKYSVNPYGSWKWAMENMPVFRKRWESRQAGDTRLMDDPTDWKMWKTDLVKKATMLGMSPNALVDGVTCAVGARAIYESRYRKYKKIGATDETARKRALQDAEIGYNLTQQSSEGAFVSAVQKDRTVAANMLSVFRNSSMAYTRQWVDASRNLRHRMQKGYRDDSIRFMARQMQEQFGLDETQAQKAAEAEYARAGRRDVARLLNMMFGVTVAWNLGASLPYLLIGDDDHTKKEMLTDAMLKAMVAGPTEGFAGGNLMSDIAGRMLSEQTRNTIESEGWGAGLDAALKQGGDYEINPLPLMADIQGMIKKMGYDKYAAAQDVFNICMQSAVGVNPQTFTDMWNACMDYGAPGWDGTSYTWDKDNMARPKEIALFLMRMMNAPVSSWRNKYIDELGMNAEDAEKLSYDEMARRYAHYKHWKDAPLTGWLRGDETRQEKMDKIRKQFDKAVDERIARLTNEELRDNLGRSTSIEERRRYAKLIHSRIGGNGQDAKNAKEEWQQNYQQLMQYDDISEDELLSVKKKEARTRGDNKTVKAIQKLQDRIRDKGKKKLGSGDDAERMEKIRHWRREALELAMRAEEGVAVRE